jgi:hypothetical protein
MDTESRAAISTPLASLARDVRFAVRSFRVNPMFTAAEVRSSRIRPRIGYLRFDSRAIDLPARLEPVLAEFRDTDGLVLDLRQNRGGTSPGVDRLAKFLMADAGLPAVTDSPRFALPRTGTVNAGVPILVQPACATISGPPSARFARHRRSLSSP